MTKHKEAKPSQHIRKDMRGTVQRLVDVCIQNEEISIPEDLALFRGFVNVVHQRDNFDHHNKRRETIGKLKYAIIQTIISPDRLPQADNTEVAIFPAHGISENTAQHFYQSILTTFTQDPWEIPFTTINFLVHQIQGEDFAPVRDFLRSEGSDVIVAEASQSKRKFKALWDAYEGNRTTGIDRTKYFGQVAKLL